MANKGKRLRAAYGSIDRDAVYGMSEAIKLIKGAVSAKFDETVEISMNLGVDPRHSDQMVRGVVSLPHGTGKSVRVAVFARTWECDEAPGDLDLCLELKLAKRGRGVVLYSASKWERKDARPAAVNRLLATATDPAVMEDAAASLNAPPRPAPAAAMPEWFQLLR